MNPQSAMVMQGGAVGAATGSPASNSNHSEEMLNTYIYDHLLRQKHWDLARSFYQSCPINMSKTKKEMNGDGGMDTDSKDGIGKPDDLPDPNIGPHHSDNSFLFDWWSQFWDVFATARGRGPATSTQYYAHNVNQAKMRNLSQQSMMGMNTNMMGRPQQFQNMQQANGINNMNNMQKQAIANRNGMQQMMANKMQNNNMQEGDRPQSPGSMGNAPSPSKRPRLDDGQFNGQQPQAGRGQPVPGAQMNQMPGGPNGMMLPNGMPADMNPLNFAQNGQQKLDMSGVAPQGMDGSFDMMNQQRPMANGAANPSQGNHALQDYQMQLMLLEQQNKKRLLMARQEQDNVNHVPGSSQAGQIQFAGAAPGMSPQNGRPGPSPNPNDQMKRMATPKMGPGAMPGSPAMGDANRGSPMPGQFDQNNLPPQMRQQMAFAAQQQSMMAQGQAPSSHPGFQNMQMGQIPPNMNMEQMQRMAAAQQQGRLPNGAPWPQGGQPMMQTPSQQGVGTPQQRPTNMPPPPAPSTEQQRTQPSSPAQGAGGPPTPSQAPKAAPKGKKEANKKNAPQKGAAAKKDAATPAAGADAAAAATPTPSTPITPMHNASFANQKAGANATAGGPVPPAQQPPPPAVGMGDDAFGFNNDLSLDFANDSSDVLESFDFDSFLHNTDDANNFGGFDFMNIGLDTEASAGS